MKMTFIGKKGVFLSLLLLFALLLTGCGTTSDSLNCKEDVESLLCHSTDRVYKVYYVAGRAGYFFGELYNGNVSLEDLNTLVMDRHLEENQSEAEKNFCVSHKYVICCGNTLRRTVDSCNSNYLKGTSPRTMNYLEDPSLVFDKGVEVTSAYLLISSNEYINSEYIYFITDQGDYIFICDEQITSGQKDFVNYLIPAQDFCKHCADKKEDAMPEVGVMGGGYDYEKNFENIESYRHTEPYKPE